jgi:hypothetical protein
MAKLMGLGTLSDATFKRKFRWLFSINGIIGDSVNALLPNKGARPTLSFKSQSFEHLNETISFPVKPEWKPINIVLYDTKCKMNPIWTNWIQPFYSPKIGNYNYSIDAGYKKEAILTMLDGCGNTIESWTFENAYPEEINFDDLDMSSNDILNISLSLKYDRAYFND